MAKISETELRRKLKKLEAGSSSSSALVKRVGDQYEYAQDFIYIAYASALSNLSDGTIPSQSDATDFQFEPYNTTGNLLTYRGYFINKSVYQSGDPTDYLWEATSGASGFTSSERYYTTSTGLQNTLGNPTKPGSGITWTVITAGTAVPGTAVYLAERYTITTTEGATSSSWKISAVGKHIDTSVVASDAITATEIASDAVTADAVAAGAITATEIASNAITSAKVNADAITVNKIDLDGQLDVTADSGSIAWGKTDGDDISNTGLFIGRNASGDPRFIIGNATSFMQFDGTVVSFVGGDIDDSDGTNEVFLTDTSITHRYTIGPNIATINIQMLGGGGGGNRNGTSDWSGPNMEDGGDTIVVIKNSSGVTQTTYTAAGGADGWSAYGGGNYGGGGSPGEAGESFPHPGGGAHSSFAGTGGAGGAYNTNNAGAAGSGYGAGGGGQGQAGGGSAAAGGYGGHKGTFYSTTYTVPDTTYYLDITVGAGGGGQHRMHGNTPNVRAGGSGSGGLVRLQGAIA